MSEAAVTKALAHLGIQHQVIEIDPDYADTDAFCARYGYPLRNSGNTIIVASRREPKVYCACLVQADRRLDVNHRVRELTGVRRLSFASPEETRELTGMMIGGVTVFGLPSEVPLYLDAPIMDLEYVVVGGGSRSLKVSVAPAELTKIPATQVVEGLTLAVD